MEQIRVALVEDDSDWWKIIETIIGKEDDMILIGCGKTKEEALKLSEVLDHIDIFLIDINLTNNNLDGIYAALELKENRNLKIIMLTSMSDEEVIQKSFAAGAVDYILKKDVNRIAEIIRSTYEGTTPIQALIKDYNRLKDEEQLKELTTAERQVYDLVEKGYSRKEMQKKLVKSENTLKNQIKNILKKLSVSSTKEAIRKVKSRGL
jgi:NarL family two-component system response regulator LiaR